jgi:hypothetical protein
MKQVPAKPKKSLIKNVSAKIYGDYDSALSAAKQMGSDYTVGLVGPKQGGSLYNKKDGYIIIKFPSGKK